MSCDEIIELRQYLNQNQRKKFIQTNYIFTTLSVILVKNLVGKLCFYVNYQILNAIIIKHYYPLLFITETLNHLYKNRIYTKLDTIRAFNCPRIKKNYDLHIAFKTYFGLYEYFIMFFRFCNGFALFFHYIKYNLFTSSKIYKNTLMCCALSLIIF